LAEQEQAENIVPVVRVEVQIESNINAVIETNKQDCKILLI
jgi:hypothetical protein